MWWYYSLQILIFWGERATNTKGFTVLRNGLILQDWFFELLGNIRKQMFVVWDHACIRPPHGQRMRSAASLQSSWTMGMERRNCNANGPSWQKDTNLCLENKSWFVGHLAANISGKTMFSLDCHHLPKLSPTPSVFSSVPSLQSAFFAGKFPPPSYLIEARFTFTGNFNIWRKERRHFSWELFLCF